MNTDKSNPLDYYDALTDQYFSEKPDLKHIYIEYLSKVESATELIAALAHKYIEPINIRISKQELQLGQASVTVCIPELANYSKKKKKKESSLKNYIKVKSVRLSDFELIADNITEAKRLLLSLKPKAEGDLDTVTTMDLSLLMVIEDYFIGQIIDKLPNPALVALVDKHVDDISESDFSDIATNQYNILCNPTLIGLFAFNTGLSVAEVFALSNKSKVSLLLANCLLFVGDKSKKLQRQIETI